MKGESRSIWLVAPAICLLLVGALEASAAALANREAAAQKRSLVEQGQYLATVGNCVSCHTRPQGEYLSGGVRFETRFGTVYAANITPEPETGLGRWSLEQFVNSMRQGVRPDGSHLYPVFPYTAFAKVTDGDLRAIFAYLRSVPPVRYRAPDNELTFPFSFRSLIGLWKAFYLPEGAFEPDPTRSAQWNRGAYLVQGLGHCGACHTPRNFLGAQQEDLALAGGSYLDRVQSGQFRPWSAVNLTSAPTGLGPWSLEDIAAYLKDGINDYASVFGPMVEVVMNSTRHLSSDDLDAVSVYLHSLEARESNGGSAPDDGLRTSGAYLYSVHCATCHLDSGDGSKFLGPSLKGNPVVQSKDPSSLINVIVYGPRLPEPALPAEWQPMEAYGNKLTNDEVAAIATFIRDAWGNQGGAVSAEQVAEQIH